MQTILNVMKTILHRADSRGHANHGWLDSHHTFSFAGYYNPERVHFGALRVLNDDIVQPGMGFGTHPHDNMEIVSIPLQGDLAHQDSEGNGSIIKRNDVQIMSAGTGIFHSEKNPNSDQLVNFLQIWVFPRVRGIAPRYEQKTFLPEDRINQFQTVVAPEKGPAVWINQNAWFSLATLKKGFESRYSMHGENNGLYAFVIEGSVNIEGQSLGRRDGLGIEQIRDAGIQAAEDTELLLMEVPMNPS